MPRSLGRPQEAIPGQLSSRSTMPPVRGSPMLCRHIFLHLHSFLSILWSFLKFHGTEHHSTTLSICLYAQVSRLRGSVGFSGLSCANATAIAPHIVRSLTCLVSHLCLIYILVTF